MGAGVSAGANNDELIDNLIDAHYIETWTVERVFRAVDRGAYFLPDPPADPYRDVAWKNGNFHISAPCIYSEAIEKLKLKPGLSFLNLGSGTGYLNTVAGLILGSYGINHGLELHEDVIRYAYLRLEDFKKHSGAMDEFDFCEPKFMQGNCLCLASGYHLYDRVYCGAACPEKYLNYLKNLIKVGGILVVPFKERLIEMRRISETNWTNRYLLSVSFTSLVKPEKGSEEVVPLFDIEPLSLQELCRTTIRNILRKIIEFEIEHPSPSNIQKIKKARKPSKKKKPVKRDRNGRKDTPRTSEELLDFFLLTIAHKKKRVNTTAAQDRENSERSTSSSANNDDGDTDGDPLENMQDYFNVLNRFGKVRARASTSDENQPNETEGATSSKAEADQEEIESTVIVHRENVSETESKEDQDEGEQETNVSYNITVEPMVIEEDISETRKVRKSEENASGGDVFSEPVDMVGTITSSSEDEQENKRCKRGPKEKIEKRSSSKWRRIDRVDVPKKCSDSEDSSDTEENTDSENEFVEVMNRKKMYVSPYSVHMKNKIQQLPLPFNVKKFLHFYREF